MRGAGNGKAWYVVCCLLRRSYCSSVCLKTSHPLLFVRHEGASSRAPLQPSALYSCIWYPLPSNKSTISANGICSRTCLAAYQVPGYLNTWCSILRQYSSTYNLQHVKTLPVGVRTSIPLFNREDRARSGIDTCNTTGSTGHLLHDVYEYSSMYITLFFFLHLFYYPRTTLALPPGSNSDPGSQSGAVLPPPHYGTCLRSYREKKSAFSSLVDSRRIVLQDEYNTSKRPKCRRLAFLCGFLVWERVRSALSFSIAAPESLILLRISGWLR